MRNIISFAHISLDGFVAGPNGEMDWITINEEIFLHVEKRIKLGDTALYGQITFEMMEGYWPTAAEQPNADRHDKEHSKWYMNSQKVVLSKSLKGKELRNTLIISDNIDENVKELKMSGDKEILLFGSPSATHSLLEKELIDGFWLFVNPVILGEGIPLFKNIPAQLKLKLESTTQFECGVTELSYLVLK